MIRTFLLFTFTLLALLGTIHAAPERAYLEQKFKELDKNRDGAVTPDELSNAEVFKRVDRDGDGRITMDEVLVAAAAQAAERPSATAPAPAVPAPDGPHPVSASQAGIGRRIDDLRLTDLNGRALSLSQILGKNGAVIAFTSTTCPVSKRYAPGLTRCFARKASRWSWSIRLRAMRPRNCARR
jgi:hypothetical protein